MSVEAPCCAHTAVQLRHVTASICFSLSAAVSFNSPQALLLRFSKALVSVMPWLEQRFNTQRCFSSLECSAPWEVRQYVGRSGKCQVTDFEDSQGLPVTASDLLNITAHTVLKLKDRTEPSESWSVCSKLGEELSTCYLFNRSNAGYGLIARLDNKAPSYLRLNSYRHVMSYAPAVEL